MVIGGTLDTSQDPGLQQAQYDLFNDLGAAASIDMEDGRVHTTSWSDPKDFAQYAWPLIPNSGYSSSSDVNTGSYTDLTYLDNAYFYMFDQRKYTTPSEFADASLSLEGWLWVPKNCADGTVSSCKMSVVLGGCGSKYDHYWSYITDKPAMETFVR